MSCVQRRGSVLFFYRHLSFSFSFSSSTLNWLVGSLHNVVVSSRCLCSDVFRCFTGLTVVLWALITAFVICFGLRRKHPRCCMQTALVRAKKTPNKWKPVQTTVNTPIWHLDAGGGYCSAVRRPGRCFLRRVTCATCWWQLQCLWCGIILA